MVWLRMGFGPNMGRLFCKGDRLIILPLTMARDGISYVLWFRDDKVMLLLKLSILVMMIGVVIFWDNLQ